MVFLRRLRNRKSGRAEDIKQRAQSDSDHSCAHFPASLSSSTSHFFLDISPPTSTYNMYGRSLLLVAVVSACFAAVCSASVPGGQTQLTPEDISGSTIQGLVPHAVQGVKKHKEEQNSLANCIDLEGVIESGTKQVVAGFKYELVVKISPKKSTASNCDSENIDVASIPKETCDVQIWDKPGGQEKEVTVQSCRQN